MASRRIQCVRACLVAMALGSAPLSARQLPAELASLAGPADRAAEYITTKDRYEGANRAPIELTIISKADAADRAAAIADAGKRALALLDSWLGPLETDRLTIVDAPWNSRLPLDASRGIVVVRSRWLTPSRDRALERGLIAGLSRQYWFAALRGDQDWLVDGLSIYIGGRAIDTFLEGSQFYADRFLGGFVPYALRPVSLSPLVRDQRPRLRRYAELDRGAPGPSRVARALEVAERYLGWPAVQQALQAFRQRSLHSLPELVAVASAQRGVDLSWLFNEAVDATKRFDYAVTAIDSRPSADQFNVRITIDRRGNGVFGRALPIEARFADGTSIRDWWDPSQPQATLDYVSHSPAVAAAIDPELVLILDEQRSNNVIRTQPQPWNRLALKLACNWAIWLQNLVITYSGIV